MDIQNNHQKIRKALELLKEVDASLSDQVKRAKSTKPADKKSDMRSALYDPREKTLQLDATREELDPKYLKYLLESLGLPKDTLVIFKPTK